jgi:hypothetical protein
VPARGKRSENRRRCRCNPALASDDEALLVDTLKCFVGKAGAPVPALPFGFAGLDAHGVRQRPFQSTRQSRLPFPPRHLLQACTACCVWCSHLGNAGRRPHEPATEGGVPSH